MSDDELIAACEVATPGERVLMPDGRSIAVRMPSGKPRIIAQCVFEPADAAYFVRVSPDVLLRLVARLRRVEQAATYVCHAWNTVMQAEAISDLRNVLAPAPPTPEGESR